MPFASQCVAPASSSSLRADFGCVKRAGGASNNTRRGSLRVAAAHVPGVVMPEGDANALNKWSRKITQPKSQGASQVRGESDARAGLIVSLIDFGCPAQTTHFFV